ncbi:sterol carrier family protein [Kibdelosporangium philippinense]
MPWLAGETDETPARPVLAAAVRASLRTLEQIAPGHTVEVRVPPFAAIQCVAGPRHTRGTPPNVIETDSRTWLELATGLLSWADAVESARVSASGTRADLAALLPIVRVGA